MDDMDRVNRKCFSRSGWWQTLCGKTVTGHVVEHGFGWTTHEVMVGCEDCKQAIARGENRTRPVGAYMKPKPGPRSACVYCGSERPAHELLATPTTGDLACVDESACLARWRARRVAINEDLRTQELIGEFSARKWAEVFVKMVKDKPAIANDEATMCAWFSSAIMAGFDRANAAALADDTRDYKDDYLGACRMIAAMHAAAIGGVAGPKRGVLEDVEDMHAELVRLRGDLLRWKAVELELNALVQALQHG